VTLVAKDVSLRQILAEWARVGQTRIVNGEKVASSLITLQLLDVPERQALEVLLRTVSGYMAAPRPVPVAGISQYDRIMILASSASPAAAGGAAPGRMMPALSRVPGQAQPRPMPPVAEPVDDEEDMDDEDEEEDEEEDDEEISEDEIDNEERQIPVQPVTPMGVGVPRPGQPILPPGMTPPDPNQQLSAPRPGVVLTPPQQSRQPNTRQPRQNPPQN
jgi:hypothetical protein